MKVIYRPTGKAAEYSHLALNHYAGCVFGCTYCYVPLTLHMTPKDFHSKAVPKKDILAKVEADAKELSGTDERVLLSFACDPYQPIEGDLRLTRQVLDILWRWSVPFQVLTKGGMAASIDFSVYDIYEHRDAFAVTLTGTSAAEIPEEPLAASNLERINVLQEAHERGIETWVSIEPVLDPEASLAAIEEAAPYADLFKIGKLNYSKTDIDWKDFGNRAIRLCLDLNKPYWIKEDLARWVSVHFQNTDNRKAGWRKA
jgi:DNA repair photolyase